MNYRATNDMFALKNLNHNYNGENIITGTSLEALELNIDNKYNNDIQSSNIEKIEFKNKSRKVAERKRKKRKTGKDIRIRWR